MTGGGPVRRGWWNSSCSKALGDRSKSGRLPRRIAIPSLMTKDVERYTAPTPSDGVTSYFGLIPW